MTKYIKGILLAAVLVFGTGARAAMPRVTGEFKDTDGKHINAHGGAIVRDNATGVYYWFGEHRGSKTDGTPQLGVAVYSSEDLQNWKNDGLALTLDGEPGTPLEPGCTIERPKVVYNPATGKWVMWFHHELRGRGYGAAFAGVATADKPEGPYTLIATQRVNPGFYPMGMSDDNKFRKWNQGQEWWTPEWRKDIEEGLFVMRDFNGGQMARDMTVFIDDDGRAYHVYSSEDNLTIQIADLDSTYTRHTGRYSRVAPAGHNEAPAIFKHDGKYWMITSGCTGWAPNEARMHVAENIHGPWAAVGNPCRGEGAKTTFDSQSTAVFTEDGKYYYMGDCWNPGDLRNSGHLWLPIQFDKDGRPFIEK